MDYIEIQSRLKRLNKTQLYLSRKFNRKPSQISMALKDGYPTLKNKIIKHLDKLESNLKDSQWQKHEIEPARLKAKKILKDLQIEVKK